VCQARAGRSSEGRGLVWVRLFQRWTRASKSAPGTRRAQLRRARSSLGPIVPALDKGLEECARHAQGAAPKGEVSFGSDRSCVGQGPLGVRQARARRSSEGRGLVWVRSFVRWTRASIRVRQARVGCSSEGRGLVWVRSFLRWTRASRSAAGTRRAQLRRGRSCLGPIVPALDKGL